MKERIAVGGSAADPPHKGHLALLKALRESRLFDTVIWILSGDRQGKKPQASPDDRVAMTEILIPDQWRFRAQPKLVIKYQDAYGSNTPTIRWLERLRQAHPDAEIVWYTGVDSIIPQSQYHNQCEIQAIWKRSEELMRNWKFLIIPRVGYTPPWLVRALLPDYFQYEVLDVVLPNVASSEIRHSLAQGMSPYDSWIKGWLTETVAHYIHNFALYRSQ